MESSAVSFELSIEQQQVVRETLSDILAQPLFSKSKRYSALLEHIVVNSFEGKCAGLKERMVGKEVFGRPADYDVANDPVVRIAAGEVRKRLAQYFNAHPDSAVHIELPTGAYLATFHFPPPPAKPASTLNSEGAIAAFPDQTDFSDAALIERVHTPPDTLSKSPLSRVWRSRFPGILAAVLILGAAGFALQSYRAKQTRSDFWQPILTGGQAPLMVVGRKELTASASVSPAQVARAMKFNYLALNDATVAVGICSVVREYKQECDLASAPAINLDNLHGRPIILIGGFTNNWTHMLLAPLRYQLQHLSTPTTHYRQIVDSASKDAAPLLALGQDDPDAEFTKDYAIVARFHSDITSSMAVVIAGLGPAGTDGAWRFLSSPAKMREIVARSPKSWPGTNFEAVMEINVVDGNPGQTQVIATTFW